MNFGESHPGILVELLKYNSHYKNEGFLASKMQINKEYFIVHKKNSITVGIGTTDRSSSCMVNSSLIVECSVNQMVVQLMDR